jgi:chromosome segregation ATPase
MYTEKQYEAVQKKVEERRVLREQLKGTRVRLREAQAEYKGAVKRLKAEMKSGTKESLKAAQQDVRAAQREVASHEKAEERVVVKRAKLLDQINAFRDKHGLGNRGPIPKPKPKK